MGRCMVPHASVILIRLCQHSIFPMLSNMHVLGFRFATVSVCMPGPAKKTQSQHESEQHPILKSVCKSGYYGVFLVTSA